MGLQDLRLAVRLWWRNPWFAALAAIGLGLGIGVNNTFFALTNAAVIRGLPIEQADRVMFVGSLDAQDRVRGLSREDVRSLRERTTTMAGVAAFSNARLTLTEPALPADAVTAASISHDGLSLLGREPTRGRAFNAGDDAPGAPLVTILSDRLWEQRYQRDPGILGRPIALDGRSTVVVGVMGPGFQFPGGADLWVPLATPLAVPAPADTARTLSVFGRLRTGASRDAAQAELATLAAQWNAAAPAGAAPVRTTVVPINDQMVGRVTDLVWVTFLTVGALVLVIACANVANLLLMRGAERSHEFAIRTGLGASRTRLVRQLLAEGLVLAAAGGVIGVGLSLLGLRALSLAVPADVQFLGDLRLDARVMTVMLGTSFGSVILFGLAPALHLSNVAPGDGLTGSRTTTRARRRWWIATFLAVEFALTLVLACSVVLGMRFNQAARAAQYQFDTAPLFTASVTLPPQAYPNEEARDRFYQRLEADVAAQPGIDVVSIASSIPGGGGPLRALTVDGRAATPGNAPEVTTVTADSQYFRALGVPLLRGQGLTASDGDAEALVVVNQRFVDLHFPSEEAIGRRIQLAPPPAHPPTPLAVAAHRRRVAEHPSAAAGTGRSGSGGVLSRGAPTRRSPPRCSSGPPVRRPRSPRRFAHACAIWIRTCRSRAP